MAMVRKEIKVTQKQQDYLSKLPARTQGEIIRRALDEYIERKGVK